jgi:HemX protein
MDSPANWILLLGTLCYVGVLVVTLLRLYHQHPPLHATNFLIILGGWLLQSAGLWLLGMDAGSCPIRNPFEVLQFVSWSIVVLYLFTGQVFRLSLFGSGSASLAAVISLLAFLIPGGMAVGSHSLLGGDPLIETHAALALLSYGIFGLLAVLAALYLLQNHSLKTKRHAGVFRFLPSIMDMDTVLLRLLIMACVVYTVSILIGALYWVDHMEQVSLPKMVFTMALWIAYCVVLFMRTALKLFGTRLAWSCLALFVVALLTLWPVEASRDRGPPVDPSAISPPPGNAD